MNKTLYAKLHIFLFQLHTYNPLYASIIVLYQWWICTFLEFAIKLNYSGCRIDPMSLCFLRLPWFLDWFWGHFVATFSSEYGYGPCLDLVLVLSNGALYCMQWTFPKWATSRQWSDWRDHHVPYSATVLDICCLTAAEIYIISWVDTNHACSARLSKFPTYRLPELCQYSCRRDEKGVLVSVCAPGGSVRTPELCSWDVRDVPIGSWWIFPWIFHRSTLKAV